MNDAAIGRILGPNITAGKGGRTAAYTMADWDRIVRHGIKPDGRPAVMPSEDFLLMSDQELSDVVAFLRSQPTVDAEVERPTFGPIGPAIVTLDELATPLDLADKQERYRYAIQRQGAEAVLVIQCGVGRVKEVQVKVGVAGKAEECLDGGRHHDAAWHAVFSDGEAGLVRGIHPRHS